MRLPLALLALTACQAPSKAPAVSAPDAAPTPVPRPPDAAPTPPPPPEEHAFILDERGLLEVAIPSGKVTVLGGEGATHCGADARSQVVWLAGGGSLAAYDLVDHELHTILRWKEDAVDSAVVGVGERRYGTNDPFFSVGLFVDLATQKLSVEEGCDGDGLFVCFEDDGETPRAEHTARVAAAKKVRLADRAYLKALATRPAPLASPALFVPPAIPATGKPPAIDPAACPEDPDLCGKLFPIPGTTFAEIIIGNVRGDFYHEFRGLWSPRQPKRIFYFVEGEVQSAEHPPRALDGTDSVGDLWVSPRGTLSAGGHVFVDTEVVFRPEGTATSCGWRQGGIRTRDLANR
jgi:hypothetical protein